MPYFPIYRGKLPTCLNALNFYHYLLLAYWCFFRPTALKCYFYQAEPHLYGRTLIANDSYPRLSSRYKILLIIGYFSLLKHGQN